MSLMPPSGGCFYLHKYKTKEEIRMQIFRVKKDSRLKTKAIIITHMDLDGIMSGYLCDLAYRSLTGYLEEQVQIVGDYSPEPKSTVACLKQVLYKLKVDEEVSIFVLDRSNMTPNDISKLIEDGWIKPGWKITCIDHHVTNFKPEDYNNINTIRINQIVNSTHSGAMNVLLYFEQFGFKYDDKLREIARLTSIYDRFAWLTEDIDEEDERDAKYLNRACTINHRNDFIKMIDRDSLEDIIKIGESASIITGMIVKKIYRELSDDNNDFLLHTFKNRSEQTINVLFIRKYIEYMYVSELSEFIFNENEDIHIIVFIDPHLNTLSLRSRESGKYINISDMISTLGLKGGGHPGAGGYYANKVHDKIDFIENIYFNQSQLIVNFIDDLSNYMSSKTDLRGFKYAGGSYFYGINYNCKTYLEGLIKD